MDTQLKKGRFTEYGNRIGLMLAQSGEVVLSFPFKDAILEGGMSREDTGREERFFHEVVDRSDIDTLQERKVLTGFRRIDSSGDHEVMSPEEVEFFDSEGELRSNLLIKGNNLVALYTLRDRLAGKVKLIYIDPPYNTQTDSFKYNDNFNHSTWLTFMKNRLEIARELLRDDGVILMSCDDNEQAYLKVLSDEIFGRDNFIANFVWRSSGAGGLRGNFIVKNHEYVLCYVKNKENHEQWFAPYSSSALADFKEHDEKGRFKAQALYLTSLKQTDNQSYYINLPDGSCAKPPIGIGSWRYIESTFQEEVEKGNILFKKTKNSPLILEDGSQAQYNIYTKQYIDNRGTNPPSWIDDDYVDQTRSSKAMFKALFDGKNVFDYAKPISLLKFLFKIILPKDGLVLDFYAGSGTTAHALTELNQEDGGRRKFILIEQIEAHTAICAERLQRVMARDSYDESFLSLELKTYNEEYLERIELARTKEELHRVYADMARNAFLQFWFDRRDFERDEYKALPLEEQKVKLRDILDLNHLYLNYQDMRDARHRVSPIDQSLTDAFYGS